MYKKIISYLDCDGLSRENILIFASQVDKNGWDELYVHHGTNNELKRENFLGDIKSVIKEIDIPVMIGTFVRRFEDIKKALYTGAKYCVINYAVVEEKEVIIEGVKRFPNKLILDLRSEDIQEVLYILNTYKKSILGIILTNKLLKDLDDVMQNCEMDVFIYEENVCNITTCLQEGSVSGVISKFVVDENIMDIKNSLKEKKLEVNTLVSNIDFKEFKLNSDGLIPVITQDYKTGEVLMLAYMNQEAFEASIQTGRMTYFSRSRNELWIKGETSSHYQYIKSLDLDCDKDTLLAKVKQIGAACHTGSKSCFYTNLVKKEYEDTNLLNVINHLYEVIKDRKDNPKEGSYTNYLFDKGIDKILKKCGEEATEIIIAAKNQNPEELKYEISDFMYHLMVLMAECNMEWSDVLEELANR